MQFQKGKVLEFTPDQSPQQDIEEGLHSKHCDLDTKYIFS